VHTPEKVLFIAESIIAGHAPVEDIGLKSGATEKDVRKECPSSRLVGTPESKSLNFGATEERPEAPGCFIKML
jgi:hypothetical protein